MDSVTKTQEETENREVDKQLLEKNDSHNYEQNRNETYEFSDKNWKSERELASSLNLTTDFSRLETETENETENEMLTKESETPTHPTKVNKTEQNQSDPYDKGYSKQAFNNSRTKEANRVNNKTNEESFCWTDMDMIDRIYPHPAHKFESAEYTRRDRINSEILGSEVAKNRKKMINQFFEVDSQFSLGWTLLPGSTEPSQPAATKIANEDAHREVTKDFKYIKQKKPIF
jgi:hypothetical protein